MVAPLYQPPPRTAATPSGGGGGGNGGPPPPPPHPHRALLAALSRGSMAHLVVGNPRVLDSVIRPVDAPAVAKHLAASTSLRSLLIHLRYTSLETLRHVLSAAAACRSLVNIELRGGLSVPQARLIAACMVPERLTPPPPKPPTTRSGWNPRPPPTPPRPPSVRLPPRRLPAGPARNDAPSFTRSIEIIPSMFDDSCAFILAAAADRAAALQPLVRLRIRAVPPGLLGRRPLNNGPPPTPWRHHRSSVAAAVHDVSPPQRPPVAAPLVCPPTPNGPAAVGRLITAPRSAASGSDTGSAAPCAPCQGRMDGDAYQRFRDRLNVAAARGRISAELARQIPCEAGKLLPRPPASPGGPGARSRPSAALMRHSDHSAEKCDADVPPSDENVALCGGGAAFWEGGGGHVSQRIYSPVQFAPPWHSSLLVRRSLLHRKPHQPPPLAAAIHPSEAAFHRSPQPLLVSTASRQGGEPPLHRATSPPAAIAAPPVVLRVPQPPPRRSAEEVDLAGHSGSRPRRGAPHVDPPEALLLKPARTASSSRLSAIVDAYEARLRCVQKDCEAAHAKCHHSQLRLLEALRRSMQHRDTGSGETASGSSVNVISELPEKPFEEGSKPQHGHDSDHDGAHHHRLPDARRRRDRLPTTPPHDDDGSDSAPARRRRRAPAARVVLG